MENIADLLVSNTSSQSNFSATYGRNTPSMSPIRQPNNSVSTQSLQQQSGQNLQIREDPKTGIFVHGLTQIHVKTKEQLLQYVQKGIKRRNVNVTGMNKNSSRSHAVLNVFVEQRWVEKEAQGPSSNPTEA